MLLHRRGSRQRTGSGRGFAWIWKAQSLSNAQKDSEWRAGASGPRGLFQCTCFYMKKLRPPAAGRWTRRAHGEHRILSACLGLAAAIWLIVVMGGQHKDLSRDRATAPVRDQ